MSNNVIMRTFLSATILCFAIISGWANAETLYEQPLKSRISGGASSQYPIGNLTLDNFTLTHDAIITDLQWYGCHSTFPGEITQFEISFWSDNAGLPGDRLHTYTIIGNAAEQHISTFLNYYGYSYSVTLPTPFCVTGEESYWLSIQPTMDFPPQWYWPIGTGGDNQCVQFRDNSYLQSVGWDCPFELMGIIVPEPTTITTLLGMAIVGMIAWRRN